MKIRTRQLTLAALTAAAYAVLSYFGSIFGITYGPIQCRFSEALCVLPFFLPETAWGLGVGCLIANLLSPYGVLDIVVGSAATLLAALLTARCKKMWLAPLPPVLTNTVPNSARTVAQHNLGIVKDNWGLDELLEITGNNARYVANCVAYAPQLTSLHAAETLVNEFLSRQHQ